MYGIIKIIFEKFLRVIEANFYAVSSTYIELLFKFLILYFIFFFMIDKIYLRNKLNWWIVATIGIILCVFMVGLSLIDKSTNLEFSLNDENKNLNKTGFNLKCDDNSKIKRLFYDSEYFCHIENLKQEKIEVVNLTGSITFKSKNGNNIHNFKDTIKFKVPINSTHLLVKFSGYHKNIFITWSSGRHFNFITKEKEEEVRKEFLKNLSILFVLVFFSIPSMFVNFKKLSKKEEIEKNKTSKEKK